MDILLLCKVVDNFGDIGVVYRLARSLSELPDPPRLRLAVDELASFRALESAVDPAADRQSLRGWELFRWGAAETCSAAFRAEPPHVVLECFACGRPDWLESLLFDDPEISRRGCLVVDLEYLTAESYAEDFHRMPSLTRSSAVRKAMFLPGFTPKTGGLILDRDFMAARGLASNESGRLALRRRVLERAAGAAGAGSAPAAHEPPASASLAAGLERRFWLTVFSYERDYAPLVAELAVYAGGRSLLVLAAAGKSQSCLRSAWEVAGRPFPLLELPFLPQEAWDEVLVASDFSMVRGEDSWARAALAGRPFLWQAYPQAERYQMVKVEAFLELLRPRFAPSCFAQLARSYRELNDRDSDGPATGGGESLRPLLEAQPELKEGFEALSADLVSGPGLAANLMTFLREMV